MHKHAFYYSLYYISVFLSFQYISQFKYKLSQRLCHKVYRNLCCLSLFSPQTAVGVYFYHHKFRDSSQQNKGLEDTLGRNKQKQGSL